MSIFGYLILIFIVIRLVNHFMKQGREQNRNSSNSFNWADSYSQRLRSVLKTCEGFNDDEIIDSATGFYLFSYDSTAKEFIFIEDDGVIHWLSYHNLIEYKIRESKDYRIMIDLKTSFPAKPDISIECFDREKLLKKMPQLQYKLHEIDTLYELERDKVGEIEDMLIAIIDEIKNASEMPPLYEEEKEEEVLSETLLTPVSIEDIVVAIEEKEGDIPEEKEILAESMSETPDSLSEIVEEISESIQEIEKPIDNHELVIGEEVPVIEGKTHVLLSEIDDYSRGKFLEYEVQSAVSDAKMKGQRYVYLTDEQLKRLKS